MLKCHSQSFKFRLLATEKQKQKFVSWAGTCRFLFNLGLEHRILSWNSYRLNVSYVDQANCLKEMKKVEGFEWIKETPAQLLQQSLKDLERAFKNFFQIGSGFPSFKRKGQRDAFRFPDPKQFSIEKINRKFSYVTLPKIGKVKWRQSRNIAGRIRNATVSRTGDHWYISFNCEVEVVIPDHQGPMVGIDRGIVKSMALSTGHSYQLPTKIQTLESRLSYYQRSLKNKKKFSANWRKLIHKISKIHRQIVRIREYFLHFTSTEIAKNHSYIVMEDLKVKNMSKSASGTMEEPGSNVAAKSGLNRSILRQGWHKFEVFLSYKSEKWGAILDFVQPHHTSQECSQCQYRDKENRKSQEGFCCQQCGHQENADFNAAKVILTRGRRGRVCGGTGVTSTVEAETTYGVLAL